MDTDIWINISVLLQWNDLNLMHVNFTLFQKVVAVSSGHMLTSVIIRLRQTPRGSALLTSEMTLKPTNMKQAFF